MDQTSQVVYNNLTIDLHNENEEADNEDTNSAETLLIAMVICFVVCWLPFFTAISQSEETVEYSLKKLTFFLAIVKSSVNPLNLFCVNIEFKVLLKRIKKWFMSNLFH